jgi:ABC-type lipoprotein release transport system permease subunit
MFSNIKLAWRNLWRNPRRTLITIASVFFGVLLSTIMSSMQEGSYSSMIDNVVKFYSGYIQIQHEEYWEDKTINNLMDPTEDLISTVTSVEEITHATRRLESFSLASSEDITRGSMIIGIDPANEQKVTGLKKWITKGEYLESGDNAVMVASELAKYLKLDIGDTITLYSMGYHGVTAAGIYPIKGILKFPAPELNRQTIYMPLELCMDFYGTNGLVTSVVLMIEDQYQLDKAMRKVEEKISSPYAALSWSEMQPELLQFVEADRAGAVVMKAILYILIGFGIFGTVMMMVMERRREMGVMVAIGMQKHKLAGILFYETVFIGLAGVLAGFVASMPVIGYFYNNPIELTGDAGRTMEQFGVEPYMYFSWLPRVFYNQVIVVFLMTAAIAVYPLLVSMKLKVHEALRA